MRPVYDAALSVPDVLALERDRGTGPQTFDARGDVDVVRDEHRTTGREANDETLVPLAFAVVGEHARHDTRRIDCDFVRVTGDRPRDARIIDDGRCGRRTARCR